MRSLSDTESELYPASEAWAGGDCCSFLFGGSLHQLPTDSMPLFLALAGVRANGKPIHPRVPAFNTSFESTELRRRVRP